ncbi:MAG: sodium pump decarboxylase subunit gamma, partial [Cellulosilyticaceae bacterium]
VIVSDPVIEAAVDLTDELELVAVITAAIAASMGTTSDRLQVRSLRQVTRQTR